MIIAAFSSCKKQEEAGEEPVLLSRDTLSEYVIVYGQNVSDELKSKVGELSLKFKDKFGIALSVKDDYFMEGVDALAISETEILIGKTNREESKEFFASLKINDYGWKVVGKKIVIGGVNDEMTIRTIDEFMSKVLSASVPEGAFYSSESDYLYTGEYQLDTITVDGKDITEYTLTYNEKVYGMDYLAEFLRDSIADKCGYYLDVKKVRDAEGLKIAVDKTDTAENALLCEMLSNGDITVGGGSSQAVYQTVMALSKRIEALSAPALDIALTGEVDDQELTVLSWNVQGQDGAKISGTTAEKYKAVFEEFKPDILMLQEAELRSVGDRMLSVLGSEYALATEFRDDIDMLHEMHNITYYKKSTVNHISNTYFWHSDTPDQLSQFEGGAYVKLTGISEFEQISTGKKILAVNVHLNLKADNSPISAATLRTKEINVILDRINAYLAEDPTATVVMGGDFNCEYTESTIKTLMNAGYANSSLEAETAEIAVTFPKHNYVIDYLFVNNKGGLMSYYKAYDLQDMNPSDHNPVIIKLCLTPELLG